MTINEARKLSVGEYVVRNGEKLEISAINEHKSWTSGKSIVYITCKDKYGYEIKFSHKELQTMKGV